MSKRHFERLLKKLKNLLKEVTAQKFDKGSNGSKIFKCKSRFWKRFRQPFVDLINSKDCINLCDLLNLTDRQKVANTFFKNTIYYKKKWRFSWFSTSQSKVACKFSAFLCFWKMNWGFQELGVAELTPDRPALNFEFVRCEKSWFCVGKPPNPRSHANFHFFL